MTPVTYVGGGKGGVGKSLVAIAIVDWLRSKGKEVVLVESDDANSDAFKCCEKVIPVHAYDFDSYDGWNNLGDLAEQSSGITIVVNSGARLISSERKFGHVLDDLTTHGVVDLQTVWPINRTRDSIRALKSFREVISAGKLAVIRNLFFGAESKFTRWEKASYAQLLVQQGVKVGSLPELSDRIADKIYDDRMPIETIMAEGSVVDQSNLGQWRRAAHAMFDAVLA